MTDHDGLELGVTCAGCGECFQTGSVLVMVGGEFWHRDCLPGDPPDTAGRLVVRVNAADQWPFSN